MNGKHTPGPWTWHNTDILAYGSVDTADCAVLCCIARTEPLEETDCEGRTWTAPGSQQANAHLIAAAPALYEALMDAEDFLSNMPDDEGDIWPIRRHMLAALSAASGEGEEGTDE